MKVVPSLQVQPVRLRVHDSRQMRGPHHDVDPAGDVGGDVALQVEDLAEIALVDLGPEVHVGGNLNELRRDPHAAAGSRHGPLDDRVDVQFAPDLGDAPLRPLVAHHRGAGRDSKAAHLDQIGDQLRPSCRRQSTPRRDRARGLRAVAPPARKSPEPRARAIGRPSTSEEWPRSAPMTMPTPAASAANAISQPCSADVVRAGLVRRPGLERDRCEESIALARQGLDELRMVGRITQGLSQVVDRPC